MKHKIRIKRRDGIRQRYWVGKKLKNYGMAFNLNKKTGYPIADYPQSFGKIGKTELVDPKLFIEGLSITLNREKKLPFDKIVESVKKSKGGDQSNTSVDKFKKLIKSNKKILPPVLMEYKDGKPYYFEGAHRAVAAYELGEKLPARIIKEPEKVKGIGILEGSMVWPYENEQELERMTSTK